MGEERLLLKEAREKCHQARDKFYKCVDSAGEAAQQPGAAVPPQCAAVRRAFEQACPSSWLRHFDQLHDKRLRYLQTIQANIKAQGTTATGVLAGEQQQ